MGYYTSYELNQTGCKEENFENLEKEVDALNVFECGDAGFGWCGVAKWYDHDEDMIRISKQFPDVVLIWPVMEMTKTTFGKPTTRMEKCRKAQCMSSVNHLMSQSWYRPTTYGFDNSYRR